MNKKRVAKVKKWRPTGTSDDIAWANEQKADLKWLWRQMVVTKIATEQKNQEKSNNSPSYRFAAINKHNRSPKTLNHYIT